MTRRWQIPARRLARVRIGALLLLGLCTSANADWRLDYGSAQQAMEKEKWAEAEALMRSARAEEPGASVRKRFQGTRFALYAPAHFAGIAAYRQGGCARALDYFSDAANRAVVAQVATLASEEAGIARKCDSHLAGTDAKRPSTDAVDAPAAPSRPPIVAAATNGDAMPVETQKHLPIAVAQEPAPSAARPMAPPVSAPSLPAPLAPPPARHAAAPTALRTILRAFVAGNYEAATQTSDAGIADPRGRALVLQVRAAAWFTRAQLQGNDPLMLAKAQQDFRASKKLAIIAPDPTLFSPKVRALFARTR